MSTAIDDLKRRVRWRKRAKRIIAACFDWRADVTEGGVVRVTARGATAGFGETISIAMARALDATLRDLEVEACSSNMSCLQKLDAVRRAAIFAVHRHAG